MNYELTDFFEQHEAEHLAMIEQEEAAQNTPEAIATREAKRKAEFDKGVRLGWWDADGAYLYEEEGEPDDENGDHEYDIEEQGDHD